MPPRAKRAGVEALEFDARGHRYYVAGREVPSVTTILEAEGLLSFGNASPQTLKAARERGSNVHLACELDDLEDLDESTLHPSFAGYLAAWRRFKVETRFIPQVIEQRIYCAAYDYAGTLDRLGAFNAGEVLIDIKTGVRQFATGPQTAAYLKALPKSEQRRTRYGVYLNDDGTYALEPYEDKGDLAVFLAALTLHNARRANGIERTRNAR